MCICPEKKVKRRPSTARKDYPGVESIREKEESTNGEIIQEKLECAGKKFILKFVANKNCNACFT